MLERGVRIQDLGRRIDGGGMFGFSSTGLVPRRDFLFFLLSMSLLLRLGAPERRHGGVVRGGSVRRKRATLALCTWMSEMSQTWMGSTLDRRADAPDVLRKGGMGKKASMWTCVQSGCQF